MNTSTGLRGVFSPVVTPFSANLAPDPKRIANQQGDLLAASKAFDFSMPGL